jgi:hypothetical protein
MPLLIETENVTRANLSNYLAQLNRCWKSSSLIWLQANGFPVLTGIIVDEWRPDASAAISEFCKRDKSEELLVRIEKPGQRWTRRRGGYLIRLHDAQQQIEELGREGIITILLEPRSPYMDLYSLTSVCDFSASKIDVEVVGPGFDASDVLRADAAPHERFEILTQSQPGFERLNRLSVITPDNYRSSVQKRLVKIGARLRNPAFPEDAIEDGRDNQALSEEALNYLKRTGQTILLDSAREYEPISSGLLNTFLGELLRLLDRVRASRVSWRTLSLSASFLVQERLVLWDFFAPGEQDTTVLSRL